MAKAVASLLSLAPLTNWTVLDRQINYPKASMQNRWSSFAVSNSTAYLKYRINITDSYLPSWVYITEMEFVYALPP